jgi:hypothetical protein
MPTEIGPNFKTPAPSWHKIEPHELYSDVRHFRILIGRHPRRNGDTSRWMCFQVTREDEGKGNRSSGLFSPIDSV